MVITYFVFILTGVFMAAAIPKLITSGEFMKTLYGVGVPHRYRRFAATAIPVAEAVSVILLLIPWTRVVGAICLLVLLMSFAIITVSAMIQKKKIDCNCFGSIMPSKLGWIGLVRLTILIAMAIYVLIGKDVSLYDRPAEEILYQIFASIGILVLYAVFAKACENWIAMKKGEV